MAPEPLPPGEQPAAPSSGMSVDNMSPADLYPMLAPDAQKALVVVTGGETGTLASDPDGDGLPTGVDDTPYGAAVQSSYTATKPVAPVKNWKVKWSTKFNPPLISYASGARVSNENAVGRSRVLGGLGQAGRIKRKGYFLPDPAFRQDWAVDQSGAASGKTAAAASSFLRANSSVLYGFKFLYNPTTLNFGVGISDAVNPGYMYAGTKTANWTGLEGGSGSVIEVAFPLTRVDDMQAIVRRDTVMTTGYQTGNTRGTTTVVRNYSVKDADLVYGKPGNFSVTQEDIKGIAERGTGYDLEFLFRAALGKEWNTVYRGQTADIGLLFSFPLRLFLSNEMIYRVRLRSVSYTHRSFTPEMVPIYTDVALSFERIPDVTGVVL